MATKKIRPRNRGPLSNPQALARRKMKAKIGARQLRLLEKNARRKMRAEAGEQTPQDLRWAQRIWGAAERRADRMKVL